MCSYFYLAYVFIIYSKYYEKMHIFQILMAPRMEIKHKKWVGVGYLSISRSLN
jgi:hypothetical protein